MPRALLQALSVLCRKTCWAAWAVTSALTSSFPGLCSPSRMAFSLWPATCFLSFFCAHLTVPVVLSAGMCCGSDTGGRAKATRGAEGIKNQPMHTGKPQNMSLAGEEGFQPQLCCTRAEVSAELSTQILCSQVNINPIAVSNLPFTLLSYKTWGLVYKL